MTVRAWALVGVVSSAGLLAMAFALGPWWTWLIALANLAGTGVLAAHAVRTQMEIERNDLV